jgi:hypothetical protein
MAARLAASFATMLPLRILEPPVELPLVPAFLFWHERDAGDPAHAWFRERIAEIARVREASRRTQAEGVRASAHVAAWSLRCARQGKTRAVSG